ncbi:MAG TPA: helix-turn-helix domain-containing protein [Thermomicrobiaceae bacterium]|nr:helix-turn-helix domain-containing protein [Thermomicrobiaceae bacterium]
MQTDNPARAAAHAQAAICPRFHYAVELIGRRWTGAILRALLDGATRFTDITCAVPGLSDRLLSERLRELESEAIVTRTVIPEMPVRVEYQLTDKGRALESVMAAIGAWATEWVELPEDAEESGGGC